MDDGGFLFVQLSLELEIKVGKFLTIQEKRVQMMEGLLCLFEVYP